MGKSFEWTPQQGRHTIGKWMHKRHSLLVIRKVQFQMSKRQPLEQLRLRVVPTNQ